MPDERRKLKNPPIVEAVVDIDCDMPTSLDIRTLETDARVRLSESYPKFRTQSIQEHEITPKDGSDPQISSRNLVQALQFLQEDEIQLVQIRRQGFSFNRLAPYLSFDDYLPEIERTWKLFVEIAKPVQTRVIRMRYINRLPLPAGNDPLNLDEFFKTGPRLPDEDRMVLRGFLHQHVADDRETGAEVRTILNSQNIEGDVIPVIFDITVAKAEALQPGQWERIQNVLSSLRELKNLTFHRTLNEKCLALFQ